jgi:hypothetical protein
VIPVCDYIVDLLNTDTELDPFRRNARCALFRARDLPQLRSSRTSCVNGQHRARDVLGLIAKKELNRAGHIVDIG